MKNIPFYDTFFLWLFLNPKPWRNIPFSNRFFLWLFLNHKPWKNSTIQKLLQRLGHRPVPPYALEESPHPAGPLPPPKKKEKGQCNHVVVIVIKKQ
jgi:hypothetical protein